MPHSICRLLLLLAACLTLTGYAHAESTLEKVRNTGSIKVGFANEAPYSYVTTDGRLTGESPEVFKRVMKRLGVQKVEGVLTEWGALIPGLKAGRFDVIVASMYITPKRCRQISFSNPTYGIGEAFLVRKGNPEGVATYREAAAKGAKVAFIAGTAEMQHAKLAGLSRTQWVVVPDFASAVAAVKSNRAAAAALTSLTAKDLAAKDDEIERARPFTFTHEGKNYRSEGAFGFRKEDTALREAVNQELATFIGSEEHQALVAPFGFDGSNLPKKSAAQLCAGE